MSPGRLAVLIGLTLIAVAAAIVLQRRRPDPPSAPSYKAPVQLDRSDFAGPVERLLVVLFASTTCETCPTAWDSIQAAIVGPLASQVVVQRVDVQDDPQGLHARYKIDGVPSTIIAASDGVVAQAFFGPVTKVDVEVAVELALNGSAGSA